MFISVNQWLTKVFSNRLTLIPPILSIHTFSFSIILHAIDNYRRLGHYQFFCLVPIVINRYEIVGADIFGVPVDAGMIGSFTLAGFPPRYWIFRIDFLCPI
jgi:hypothetical protein